MELTNYETEELGSELHFTYAYEDAEKFAEGYWGL